MNITREGYVFYPTDSCAEAEEKIISMQMGLLSDSEEKKLIEHLESCEGCRALYEFEEMIDEDYRFFFQVKQTEPPKEMPKKLQIMLSEASKRHLAAQLQELGQSILFQQPEVCDLIRPWSKPMPLDQCVMMLNISCSSLLKDSSMQEVGLTPDFVKDCRQFLHDLVKNPNSFFDLNNAKEALDRSLSVEPNHVLSVKSMADYYFSRLDVVSANDQFKRLLKLNLQPEQKYRTYLNLSSHLISTQEYDDAMKFLDLAEKFLDLAEFDGSNFQLYFMKFKLCYSQLQFNIPGSGIEAVVDNLIKMDNSIEKENIDQQSVALNAKWLNCYKHDLNKYAIKNSKLNEIISKYSEIILD